MNYSLICSKCGKIYDDSLQGEWRLSCDNEKDPNHGKALLISFYPNQNQAFSSNSNESKEKLSDFSSFLPIREELKKIPIDTSAPICFKSINFGEKYLGLKNLWISFSGYIDNRESYLSSCTFKELEATSIFSRIFSKSSPKQKKTIVVSSAGNTARAFAQIFSKKISINKKESNNIDLIIVIPEKAIDKIWSIPSIPFDEKRVKLIVIKNGDYSDAIKMADLISSLDKNIFFPEGGAKNPARRDGMAISLLAAVFEIKKKTGKIILPDHYFQAVGSGTGGISAWEAAKRIQEYIRNIGNNENNENRENNKNNNLINKNNIYKIDVEVKMKLHLSQNIPFTPMADSWEKNVREMPSYCFDENEGKKRIGKVSAFVLTNRHPPFGIYGGVFDAMKSCKRSQFYKITNEEAKNAAEIFEKLEGYSVDPAAAVAIASLIKAVELNKVQKEEIIVLNVTGGGKKELDKKFGEQGILYLKPFKIITLDEINIETAKKIFEIN